MKTINSGIYILSINEKGTVFIIPVDMNNAEQRLAIQKISSTEEHLVFANIRAAFVDFLMPVYRKICRK